MSPGQDLDQSLTLLCPVMGIDSIISDNSFFLSYSAYNTEVLEELYTLFGNKG
jgi:hypothetical protein